MSEPTPAKRRHFERRREPDATKQIETDDDEDEEEQKKKIENNDEQVSLLRESQHPLDNEMRNSVNAKIGHFERLLGQQSNSRPVRELRRQAHAIESNGFGSEQEEEEEQFEDAILYESKIDVGADGEEEETEAEEEEEYLGLDTIVEEDEELAGGGVDGHHANDGANELRHPPASPGEHPVAMNCDSSSLGTSVVSPAMSKATTNNEPTPEGRNNDGERFGANNNHGQNSAPPAELTTVMEAERSAQRTISENNDAESINNEILLLPSSSADLSESAFSNTTAPSQQHPLKQLHQQNHQQEAPQTKKQQQQLEATNNMNKQQELQHQNHHHQKQQQQQQQQQAALLLPSTNRLISEHQARQQQALFRALAERQKLLDELAPDERLQQADLMSSLPASWSRERVRRRSRASRERAARATSGVPLSSVDLSQVSDRMLDELMGHIASASSCSSSACSLDSSEVSSAGSSRASSSRSATDDSSDDADESTMPARSRAAQAASGHRSLGQLENLSRASAAPSVIGVHDELHEQQQQQQQHAVERHSGAKASRKCREAYKKSRRRRGSDDDDEHDGDEDERDRRNPGELQLNGGLQLANNNNGRSQCSLSPAAGQPTQPTKHSREHDQRATSSVKSDLLLAARSSQQLSSSVSPTTSDEPSSISLHGLAGERADELDGASSPPPPPHSSQSVEAILGRMLAALQEVGAQQQQCQQVPEEQEQLNELLERGFLHLEQLLNCSLTQPAASRSVAGAAGNESQTRSQTSNTTTTNQTSQNLTTASSATNSQTSPRSNAISSAGASILLSKDSDYGSDTQSADCLSHSTHSNSSASVLVEGAAPVGAAAGTASQAPQPQATSAQANGQLSPLAIELSFKLAESLRKLAQQQQQLQQSAAAVAAAPQQQQSSELSHDVAATTSEIATPHERPASSSPSDAATMETNQAAGGARSSTKGRAPWKSVVMINSPQSAGSSVSSLSRPHSSQSTASSSQSMADSLAGASRRNPTPLDENARNQLAPEADSRPQSRLFKTCVSVNVPTSTSDERTRRASSSKSEREQNQFNSSSSDKSTQEASQVLQEQTQVVRVVASSTSASDQRRPRSSFRQSSLRRRPSFSASQSGGARPGSPVPRSSLAERAVELPVSNSSLQVQKVSSAINMKQTTSKQQQQEDEQQQEGDNKRQQRQLQRALVLAQKYNYSPAKLAASKLGAKLQLAGQHKAAAAAAGTEESQIGEVAANSAHKQLEAQEEGALGSERNFVTAGQVQLEISYFAKSLMLTVHLLQCTQLTAVSKRRSTSNPYVKLYLLPDRSKQGKRKSSVKRSQLNPKFDERFTFGPLQLADFEQRLLWLSVWHKERGLGARNELLGELLLPLAQVRSQLLASDLCQSTAPQWYTLCRLPMRPIPAQQPQQQQQSKHVIEQPTGTGNDESRPSPKSTPPLTTKRVPQSNGHLSMTLARPLSNQQLAPRLQQQQAAELVARKLGEFERKAARLAQQGPAAPPAGSASNHLTTTSVALTLGRSRAPLGSGANQQQQQQSEFKCMQVSLGPTGASEQFDAGQLFVALKFVPESGELRRNAHMEGQLHVLVKEARNLTANGQVAAPLPSAYCKCQLLDAFGQRVAKHKTQPVKKSDSPRWDAECHFANLQLNQLGAQALEVLVLNRDSLSLVSAGVNDRTIGAIRLCRRLHENEEAASSTSSAQAAAADLCSERESRLWTQMLARPNIWVYGELPLRRQLRPLVPLPISSTNGTS